MFGWFGRKSSEATRGDDRVWMSDAARVEGLRREVERTAGKGGNVVVVAPTMAAFEQMASALAPHQPRLCHDQFERTALHSALEGSGVVALAMPGALPNVRKAGSNATAGFLVFGRSETRTADDAIAAAADLVGTGSSVTFHLSLEDTLLRQHSAKLQPLLGKLGMTPDEPLCNPILNRAIANTQAK